MAWAELSIAGWPIPSFDEKKPKEWLSKDPVLGRLICPSLTRLNLQKKESESLVLKDIHVESNSKEAVWTLHLRSGIFWWSGSEFSSLDLQNFLKKNMEIIVEEKGSGLWQLPEFRFQTERETLKIIWKKSPEFGPYIFNGIALWRERKTSDSIKFECVGRYIPQKSGNSILLTPNSQYSSSSATLIFETGEDFDKYNRKGFRFIMSESHIPALEKHKFLEKTPCENLIDLPLMSSVIWYEKDHIQQNIRKRISSLFPREALRKIASGSWAEDPSSLIPKNHPGYDSTLHVPKFVLSRSNTRTPLYLSTQRERIGLVEKVLSDTLMVGGFDVQFVSIQDPRLEGLISGIFIPWPDLDLYDSFHSKGRSTLGQSKKVHPELDRVLEKYRKSLTYQQPDFNLLKIIHKNLYELESISVLMQHKTCLETKGLVKKKLSIDVKDPDWFLSVLMTTGGVP